MPTPVVSLRSTCAGFGNSYADLGDRGARHWLTSGPMELPEDLLYSKDHEWVRAEPGDRIRIGVTDYAQDALGDVVYVQIPSAGATVKAGESFSEVESTKSVSDIYAPASGTVAEVNDALSGQPELINSDPYGDGWLCVIALTAPDELDELLDAAAYRALIEG